MKKLLALALIGFVTLGMASLAMAKGVLKVGSDVAYPPFEYADEKTGEYTGFDMDLIKAIGEVMGMDVKIVNTAWDGIIPGLINGNYDCLISAMTITKERAEAVDFSNPYFEAGQVVVVKRNDTSIKTTDDLKDKIVAVQLGTTGDFAATEFKGLKKVARFNTSPEALQEVLNGGAHAAVVDDLVAVEFVKNNPNSVKVAIDKFTVEYYGIAVKKGNKQLLDKINAALEIVKKNGKYQEIYNKWFKK